jgi:hypothetical protein
MSSPKNIKDKTSTSFQELLFSQDIKTFKSREIILFVKDIDRSTKKKIKIVTRLSLP